MTVPMFAFEADLRAYMEFNSPGSASKYSSDTLGSNLRAASAFLERRTSRWFANRPATTLTLSTNGQAVVQLPGFRSFSSVTFGGAPLASGTTYWSSPDQSGLITSVQLRGWGNGTGQWYKGIPEWFDRNLDRYPGGFGSMPNDLVLVGDGGFLDADWPEELRLATKALAGFWTKRPDALLAGGIQTPDGSVFDYTRMPVEVISFIEAWHIGEQAVVV